MRFKNIFTHHVHFWLKNKADLPKLIEGLNTLVPIIHYKQIHIGVPAPTSRAVIDSSYDASLLMIFDDLAAQEAYQIDPTHQEFVVNYVQPLVDRVVVMDAIDA